VKELAVRTVCAANSERGRCPATRQAALDDFGTELSRWMAARGTGVRELARRAGYSYGYISQLRGGARIPSPEAAWDLDDALEADGALRRSAAAAAPRHGEASAGDSLGLIELARRAEASDIGGGTLELLAESADRLCRDYPTVDPKVLSGRARKHLDYVTDLLARRVTLVQHRDLLVIAGWLSALLACTLYDAREPAAAETARRMTRQFGEESGHGELVAWSFEIAAWYALVEGRFPRVVEECEAGLAHAGVSNAAVQLTLQASRAYARMGDTDAAKTLAAGKALLEQLPVPAHPEHHFVFDRDKFEFYTATVYTWLGTDDLAAEENAREVVARCVGPGDTVRWPTRLSTTLVNLGQIAGRRGDLDEAVGLGTKALRCGRRSAELLPRAAELEQRLAARYGGEPLVDEYGQLLREEIRALPPGALGTARRGRGQKDGRPSTALSELRTNDDDRTR
jgi:transcriptional regulator with XRE-family HTH domain